MIDITIVHALVFGVLVGLFQLVRQKDRGPDIESALIAGLCTGVAVFFVDTAVIFIFNPSMDHRLEAGGWGLTVIDFIVGAIVSAIVDGVNEGNYGVDLNWGPTIVAVVFTIVSMFGYGIDAVANPPNRPFCDTQGVAEMISQILPTTDPQDLTTPATNTLPNTNPDVLIRVTPEVAETKARQGANLINDTKKVNGKVPPPVSSYAQLNHVYLQKYNEHWVYVADFQVFNPQAFNQYGGAIPGYLIISAEDPDAQPQGVTGHKLSYVPGLGIWDHDLERTVRLNWGLSHRQYEIKDLVGGLEIDEQGNPYYMGTLVTPVVGAKGKRVVGLIQVDPATGQVIHQYDVNQTDPHDPAHIPDWVDRVYPFDDVHDFLADYWAPYFDRDPCNLGSTGGQAEIEGSGSYQITGSPGDPTGAAFVFTYTSHKNTQSLLGEVVVDPKSGHAKAYQLGGDSQISSYASQSDAVSLIDKYLASNSIKTLTPTHCQLHQIYSRPVWYCILSNGGFYGGVALLQAHYSADSGKVIISRNSLDNALAQLREQIAIGDITDNPALSSQIQHDVPFQGVVKFRSSEYNRAGKNVVGIILDGTSVSDGQKIPQQITFIADLGEKYHDLPWVQEGHQVFITANVAPGITEYEITAVRDLTVFPQEPSSFVPTPTPSPSPSTRPSPSASPRR